jgi:hypothetical protein
LREQLLLSLVQIENVYASCLIELRRFHFSNIILMHFFQVLLTSLPPAVPSSLRWA